MSIFGRHVSKLSGYAPAIPTPFDENGALDGAALERFCDRQIHEGATALVICGTTGEAPTLSHAEHDRIVRIAAEVAHGRVPVIAGAGSNSTSEAIEQARASEAAGADAILSVAPYYNKPTQAGMHAHFRAIADSVGFRSSSMTFRRAPLAGLPTPRSRASPRMPNSSPSRMRRAT